MGQIKLRVGGENPDLPETLEGVVAELGRLLKTVPVDYRSDVKIDFESEYDSSRVTVAIYYYREETDGERRARAQDHDRYQREHRAREIAAARATLARYGVPAETVDLTKKG